MPNLQAVIPIAFTVTRYRCPACARTGSSRKRIADHIARCWLNPNARACKTCTHYMPPVGEPDVGYFSEEGCAAGLSFPEDSLGRPTLAVGCPMWAGECTTDTEEA
ncbi:MAG TPA: hypothetical protein VGL02_32210 [Streptomyces sp.]